jgi:hypothetical protein
VDFQQLQTQVREMGDQASAWEARIQESSHQAETLLRDNSRNQPFLVQKLERALAIDPNLRSARPATEPLDASYPCPPAAETATIIAADGSQINPDRHSEIEFSLINVGAVLMLHGTKQAPTEHIFSKLLFEDILSTQLRFQTEGLLALGRDLAERKALLDLSQSAPRIPVLTFTDGPIELWTRQEPAFQREYQEAFDEYLNVLSGLQQLGAATAGYVDRPGANYLVRLLEIGLIPDEQRFDLRSHSPLRGATDRRIFEKILGAGCRSAVFGLQSPSARKYEGNLKLHFFYINVGRNGSPKIARVEIPGWVAFNNEMLNPLHSVLVAQSLILGNRAYPYLLHRAHEAAIVTRLERDQIIQMIIQERNRRGFAVQDVSEKQSAKDLPGRARF